MKIAYLARRPIPSSHAHAVQIVKMCEAFARNGHRVSLYALPGDASQGSAFERYGVEPNFELRIFRKPLFQLALLRDLLTDPADLYYARDVKAVALAARSGRPCVFEAHRAPVPGTKRWRRLSSLFARRSFSHLVCVTSALADTFRDQFPALRAKPIVIAPSAAAEPSVAAELPDWSGRPGHPQIGFVGRPISGKGIETMIAAAAEIGDADFHVVGAVPSDLDGWTGELPANLHFHGYQPHARIGSYLARFDIAAAPYGDRVLTDLGSDNTASTSPLKLVEYMAAGLPTIASALPGVRDIVDEQAALLVPPGDQAAFVAAARTLVEDGDLRRRLGRAARQRYLARHTMAARARLVLNGLDA